jgi:hypothetical protein
MTQEYIHYRIQTAPLEWRSISDHLTCHRSKLFGEEAVLYGIWRNQIGRARDELNILVHCPTEVVHSQKPFDDVNNVVRVEAWSMTSTLRPTHDAPPRRQGNYAFRHFRTERANWDEFLQLCDEAWPGFEASYPDCQVIGLWRYGLEKDNLISSVMLTRRPNLAAWERTKIPQGEQEVEVRRKLSRRYDLCASTYVHTTTLLTASDGVDSARWT